MKTFNWKLNPNHERALEKLELDIDGSNDGWTIFWNSEEKRKHPDCNSCMSGLIKSLEDCLKTGNDTIDVSMLKDCYKTVFTALPYRPINYLVRTILKNYIEKYGETEAHGKLGGFGKGGTRVLFFYEDTQEKAAEKKEQLIELVEDLNLIGMITETKACEYMHNHTNLNKTSESKIRRPDILLQKLKEMKNAYDKGVCL